MKQHMLFLGFGYCARTLARSLDRRIWNVTGTSRSVAGLAAIAAEGVRGIAFERLGHLPDNVTHLVSSVPPDASGDPVIRQFGQALAQAAETCRWAAYLSTTGVYGDHGGAWVDESAPTAPNTERGRRRLAAETAWQDLHRAHRLPLHVFRLAGIYGPGRNVLEQLRQGTAKRVIKPGQVFSRIHVQDIAGVLQASMARPNAGRIYNVADDAPCPPQDVVAFGATLLGVAPPPETAFSEASLSAMAASFYADSKRVCNDRIKTELGYKLTFPSYREGLTALLRGVP
jgi:nucleoside-diphosphate-sugar epimerase